MTKLLTAASVLAIAGAASAAQFQYITTQAGGTVPGTEGPGYTAVGGTFYHDAGGANVATGINAILLDFIPGAVNDTYLSISATGPAVGTTAPSAATRAFYGDLNAAANNGVAAGSTITEAPGSIFNATQMFTALGISPQPFLSGKAPNVGGGRSNFDGVFMGRFTLVGTGASLGGGAKVFLKDIGDNTTYDGTVMVNGPAVQIGDFQYQLQTFFIENSAQGSVNDLWLVQIPTPGALALFGLGGVAAIRRRRA